MENDTLKYVSEYQKLCMEQLEYLSKCMRQREALDEEIKDLFKRAKWNHAYVCSALSGAKLPSVQKSDASAYPKSMTPLTKKPYCYQPNSSRRRHGAARPVLRMSSNGHIIQRFDSLTQASEKTGILSNYISIAAKTLSYTQDGSYWRFEDSLFNQDDLDFGDIDLEKREDTFPRIGSLLFDATLPARPDAGAHTDADADKADADKASTDTAAGSDDT